MRSAPELLLALVPLALGAACGAKPVLPLDYRRALQLERRGEHRGAIEAYAAASRSCGPDAALCDVARLRGAQLLTKVGQHQAALRAFQRLGQSTLDPETGARALLEAGRLLEGPLREPHGALGLYQQVIVRYPEEAPAVEAVRALVRLYRGSDRAASLVRLLHHLYRAVEASRLAGNLLLAAAELYEARGELRQAVAILDQLAERHPKSPVRDDGIYRAGTLLERLKDWEGALRRYRKLLAGQSYAFLGGSFGSIHMDDAQLRVGVIQLQALGRPRAALESFAAVRDDYPRSLLRDDAQWWIAQVHLQSGHREASCAALARLLRDFPDGNHARRARLQEAALRCTPVGTPPRKSW
ncbi:MAG: tetratricopeptide repeat protein [Deltaproteobacteria bacterium]|nr:tetratricopeptide repeat protein [Deltaproteobacteria bacterium]